MNLFAYISVPLLGGTLFCMIAALLGFFIVARGYSLLVDVVCHATLPGVLVPYFLVYSVTPLLCLLSGSLCGVVSILCVLLLERTTRLKTDAILGVVVSFYFGLGLIMVTLVQKYGFAKQGIIQTVFLGNAGLYRMIDMYMLLAIVCFMYTVFFLWYRFLYAVVYDREIACVMGISQQWVDMILYGCLVLLSAVGLLVMGSMVMSASLIIPTVVSRQLTRSFRTGFICAGLYGGCTGACGVIISSMYPSMPTGPVIVLCMGVGLISALLYRGIRYVTGFEK